MSDITKTAPASFSLFDLLDQQKGAFNLPPRVTADMIIDAHQGEKKDGDCETKSPLELLETADDIEDLSPDTDAWEKIRQILYDGLISPTKNLEERSRFLLVHKSLHDICRRGNGGGDYRAQCWDLAQNLVGFILSLSNDLLARVDKFGDQNSLKNYIDLYWDALEVLLTSLSHLSLNCITSCSGDERQIERMVLGICKILVNDFAACTTAAMDVMSGWFEVWAHFIAPKNMLTIVKCSGLGGVVLRRCHLSGACGAAEKLYEVLHKLADKNEAATLPDVEYALFVQSLSILRTILFQCGSSQMAVDTIYEQFLNLDKPSSDLSFLTSSGVASVETVHELLNPTENCMDCVFEQNCLESRKEAIKVVFQPFHDALLSKKLNEDPRVEWLCSTSLEIYSVLGES